MNDLLRDAIADAKAVRDTAYASAKATLEEAFQPTIQRMISSKLAEEEGDEEEFETEPEMEAPAPEPEMEPEMEAPAPEAEPEPEYEEEEDLELEALIRELEMEDEDEFMAEGDYMDDGEEAVPAEMGDSLDENEDLDLELESLIRELEGEDEFEAEPEMEDEPVMERRRVSRTIQNENKQLKKKLNEAYTAISTLKTAIADVNLLNAKLMYCTKVLRGSNLSEEAQTKVLKQFDRASNIREVKLIYTTLVESIKKKATVSKRITEGASKRQVAITNKSNEFSFAPRWQHIAGIKK